MNLNFWENITSQPIQNPDEKLTNGLLIYLTFYIDYYPDIQWPLILYDLDLHFADIIFYFYH